MQHELQNALAIKLDERLRQFTEENRAVNDVRMDLQRQLQIGYAKGRVCKLCMVARSTSNIRKPSSFAPLHAHDTFAKSGGHALS